MYATSSEDLRYILGGGTEGVRRSTRFTSSFVRSSFGALSAFIRSSFGQRRVLSKNGRMKCLIETSQVRGIFLRNEEEKGGVASNECPEAGVVTLIFTAKPYHLVSRTQRQGLMCGDASNTSAGSLALMMTPTCRERHVALSYSYRTFIQVLSSFTPPLVFLLSPFFGLSSGSV